MLREAREVEREAERRRGGEAESWRGSEAGRQGGREAEVKREAGKKVDTHARTRLTN